MFSTKSIIFFLIELFVFTLHIFIFIALIVTPFGRSMSSPFSQAHPAKVMFALCTSHMIAALTFFNGFFAFGTLFGVCHNPCNVFRFCRVFKIPLLSYLTFTRFMRFLPTFEAKSRATIALNITNSKISGFNAKIAPWLRTPSDHFIIISKSFTMILQICL